MTQDDLVRVLVVGDFSGRSSTGGEPATPIGERSAPRVDRDVFAERMAATEISVFIDGAERPLELGHLDDFEPDGLALRVPELVELAGLRAAAADPERLTELHARLVGAGTVSADQAQNEPSAEGDSEGLLDAMLEATEEASSRRSTGIGLVDAAIASAMQGHRLPPEDPRRAEVESLLDSARDEGLRHVLRDSGFREVERAWRALERLVFGLDSDSEVGVHMLDATIEELHSDLGEAPSVEASQLWRRLIDGTVGSPGAPRFHAIVLLHRFDRDSRSAALLARWAKLVEGAGCVFFADAGPEAGGADSWSASEEEPGVVPTDAEEHWVALRNLPRSARICLAGPRPIDRLPYGERGRRCDLAGFSEFVGEPSASELAWGHAGPVVAAACLTAVARGQRSLGGLVRVDGLPTITLDTGFGPESSPAAEAWIDESSHGRLVEAGITVLRPVRGEGAFLVGPVRSIHGDRSGLEFD